MHFEGKSGKHLDNAINAFASLPGIGKKTALRFALHILKQNEVDVEKFAQTIINLKKETKFCSICHNITDKEICNICNDNNKDKTKICVVEGIYDIIAIEATSQYDGLYHVIGGLISPIEGIGPSKLNIESLILRINNECFKEVILALPATSEGDTTNYYISKKIEDKNILISILARGVAVGNELQYTDELSLGQSIINRQAFSKILKVT